MSTQAEVDEFIAKTQSMTALVIAFMGDEPDDTARANIRRMRTAGAALQTALEQANAWATQGSLFVESSPIIPTATGTGPKK